jgi:hypothetical protein
LEGGGGDGCTLLVAHIPTPLPCHGQHIALRRRAYAARAAVAVSTFARARYLSCASVLSMGTRSGRCAGLRCAVQSSLSPSADCVVDVFCCDASSKRAVPMTTLEAMREACECMDPRGASARPNPVLRSAHCRESWVLLMSAAMTSAALGSLATVRVRHWRRRLLSELYERRVRLCMASCMCHLRLGQEGQGLACT